MKDDKEKTTGMPALKTGTVVLAFVVVAAVCLSMMAVNMLEAQGIPGPVLYFQKEAVIKRMGAENFEKMVRVVSPQGLAVMCANGNAPAASVVAAVRSFGDKNEKQVDAFIKGLNLSQKDHDVLDRYFYLYFKREILKDPHVCATLKADIAAGKFNP
jgi:hypothetical protein